MPTHPLALNTTHTTANKLEEVYGQIYKALKPGGLFLSYEWVSTEAYDASNPGVGVVGVHTRGCAGMRRLQPHVCGGHAVITLTQESVFTQESHTAHSSVTDT